GWPSAMAFNAVNQTGAEPWYTVKNFTFRNNWMKQFGAAFVVALGNPEGRGDANISVEGTNFLFENNLFTQNNTFTGDAGTTMMWVGGGGRGVTIRHNTFAMKPAYGGPLMSI